MKNTIIVAPEKGEPFIEAWRKEIKLFSEKLNLPVITTGNIHSLISKKDNYLTFKHSILLYPVFAFYVFFKSKFYDNVILFSKPDSLYFKILVFLVGKKKIIYHFKSSTLNISEKELKEFKAVFSPFKNKFSKEVNHTYVPAGIDKKKYEVLPKKKDGKFVFLFASSPYRFHKNSDILDDKGVLILLSAFSKLNNKKFKLILLWRDKYYPHIKNIIDNRFNDADIEIINKNVDMMDYYNKADIVIHPGKSNKHTTDFPSSIMEAVSCGKPVIISDIFLISKIIKKKDVGIVCNPTEKSLLDAMRKIEKKYSFYRNNCIKEERDLFNIDLSIKALRNSKLGEEDK